MKKNNYNPQPIDTSEVTLDKALLELTEKIAENTHDVWASQRIKDGWSYNPVRDDSIKGTPCLVPYGELPESEKKYDRDVALETIKLVIKLGYDIKPKIQ